MRLALCIPITLLALSGCSSPGGPHPSLQPRAAEKIDPRIEPSSPINERPIAPALQSQLVSLIEQARTGDAAFAPAAADAERLVAAAGAAQSESWIAAQQALSAAIAARKPTAVALADVDTLAAKALQTQGGVAPNDLKAIDGAAAEVSGISIHQTDRIAAMQHRLGL